MGGNLIGACNFMTQEDTISASYTPRMRPKVNVDGARARANERRNKGIKIPDLKFGVREGSAETPSFTELYPVCDFQV